MNTLSKEEMLVHFTGQSASLPDDVRRLFLQLEKETAVLSYALLDLDDNYRLTEQWLVLGAQWCAVFSRQQNEWISWAAPKHTIANVQQASGLSAGKLTLLDAKKTTLKSLRYTRRQEKAVGIVKAFLEGERPATVISADTLYRDQTLKSVQEAQSSMAKSEAAVVWRLLGFLYPYRREVAFGMFGAMLMTLVCLIPAYLTGYIVDHVIKPFQAGLLTLEQAKQLTYVVIGALAVTYGLKELFAWVRLRTMSVLGEYVARDLRDQVYAHLHKLSLSFFSSKSTGTLITRVSSDTDRIWDFIAFGVVEVTTSLLLMLGLSIVLIALDWRLGLLVIIPVPILLYLIYRHGQRMQNLFLRAWRRWSRLTDCLSDTIPGIRVVKAFNREAAEISKFEVRNDEALNEFNNIHYTWTRFWPTLMLMIGAVIVGVYFFGVPRVLAHIEAFRQAGDAKHVGLSPGAFVSFVLYLTMLVQPIEVLGQMARMVNRATSSAHRVFEVLDTAPVILQHDHPIKLANLRGEVEFDQVSFSYDGVRKVVKSMSFRVTPGEMIGLVGPSGGGKSTITNLMARFYEPQAGTIRIDGIDLQRLELGSYRQQVGMVLQEAYLFHGSILENIRYARPDATYAEVIEAARAANAHDFICELPQSYETLVGERGHTLSGGERQRISIARAVLANPRILILDEATSAVDTETERKIQEALDRLVKGRTVFAIAHRLSTLQKATRIFVIKSGQLVEQGSHQELMNLGGGVYKKLVNMQNLLHVGV